MISKINLYSSLRNYTGDLSPVEVRGETVAECLNDLVRQFPSIQPQLFEKSGKLSSQTFISINLQSTNPEQLNTPLKKGDELYIVKIVAGG